MIQRKSRYEYKVSLPLSKPYTREELYEVIDWCKKTFGEGGRNKKYRWRYGWVDRVNDTFYFRNEKDALYFVLRWT